VKYPSENPKKTRAFFFIYCLLDVNKITYKWVIYIKIESFCMHYIVLDNTTTIMSTSSKPLRRSARLAPASTTPAPPSRAEVARQRNAKARATKPEQPRFVVVEKPRSFDVIKYPLGGYSPDDALAAAAMQKHGTTQRSAVSSPAKLRVLCAAENKLLIQKQALARLTVVQLKSKLNDYGMTTTGNKDRLVQRVLAFEIMFDNDVVMFGGVSRYSG
jgi:hypothetical protein